MTQNETPHVVVYGTYNDIHDNNYYGGQHLYGKPQQEEEEIPAIDEPKTADPRVLLAVLDSPRCQELWQQAQEQGLVDADRQPTQSRARAAMLADRMADLLCMRPKWAPFELLWHRKGMKNDLADAGKQDYYDPYRRELKRMIQ